MLWIQSLNDEVADVEFFHIFVFARLLITAGSFFCHFLSWYFNSLSQLKRLKLVHCNDISDEGLSGVTNVSLKYWLMFVSKMERKEPNYYKRPDGIHSRPDER
jgi:hypothetical protein